MRVWHPLFSDVRLPRSNPNARLYAYGGKPTTGVREIDRQEKVIWDYQSQKEAPACHSGTDPGGGLPKED